jgi:acetyl/propionyl-CoA carboxylase alpha subunit
VCAGWTVPPFYDSLLAKLIVWDETREAATARMLRALAEFRIEGLTTLVPFHCSLLASGEWARGETAANLLGDPDWLTTTASAN